MQRAAYIIVGAGTAGCAIANRLSADRHTTVVLVESGSCTSGWRTDYLSSQPTLKA